MKHLPMYTENHETPDVCAPCGGKCCKGYPGIASPTDFGAPDRETLLHNLTAAFISGKWALDWWEGDPRPGKAHAYDDADYLTKAYFVRPHVWGEEKWLRDPTYGGPCTFLTDTGCSLEHDRRPTQCRSLVPAKDGKCKQSTHKQELTLEWLPYTDIILEAERRYNAHMKENAA